MMPRQIHIDGAVARVPLTQGYVAVIDTADVPLVSAWNWNASVERRADGTVRAVYAVRAERAGGTYRQFRMHRLIAGTPDGLATDHIDGDGLNNRRDNLRTATTAQNTHNRRIASSNTSGVKGIHWDASEKKWRARIMLAGKRHSLGHHDTIDAAAEAYAHASKTMHGEFGRLK